MTKGVVPSVSHLFRRPGIKPTTNKQQTKPLFPSEPESVEHKKELHTSFRMEGFDNSHATSNH